MGKLIYNLNVSVDGFMEAPGHDLSWSTVDDEIHGWFNDQIRSLDAELYGRRIWELMSGHWPTADEDSDANEVEREFARLWKATPRFVFSSTLDHVEHGARLVRGDVDEVLADVRREFGGDIGVAGANLAGQFVRRGLVDEYRLVIHPVVLGAGTPFWPELDAPLRLRQIDQHRFASGVELRSYAPA